MSSSQEDTLLKIRSKLNQMFGAEHGIAVESSSLVRHEFGWSGRLRMPGAEPVFGLGPVVVDAANGEVTMLGTAGDPDEMIQMFLEKWQQEHRA